MATVVPVSLTNEEQAALETRAAAQGVTLDTLLRQAVLRFIADAEGNVQHVPADELDRAFEAIADLIPEGTAPIPGHALSREDLYTREDDWNRNPR